MARGSGEVDGHNCVTTVPVCHGMWPRQTVLAVSERELYAMALAMQRSNQC
jgi:hypothetical protein